MRISKECIEKAVLFKNNLFDKWHCMRNMSWWWLPDTWQICHTHSHSLQPYAPPGVARTRTRSLFVPTWDDEMHITGTCVHPHAHACTDTLTLAYTLYDIHTFQIYHWPCAQGYPNRFSWQGPHIVRRDIQHSVLTHDTAESGEATALAMKLFLRWDVLVWTCLYLSQEGMWQNRLLAKWDASATILCVLGVDCSCRG